MVIAVSASLLTGSQYSCYAMLSVSILKQAYAIWKPLKGTGGHGNYSLEDRILIRGNNNRDYLRTNLLVSLRVLSVVT